MTDTIIRASLDPELLPPKPVQTTVLGVTVGNLTAAPCLCAVRYVAECISPGDAMCGEDPVFATSYHVLGAERLPHGTSVPEIAARVNVLAKRLWNRDSKGDYHVLCDASEVGRPVIDAIRFAILPQVHVTGVLVTPTDRPDPSILWRMESTVGLQYLMSRLQAIVQGRRLHIPNHPSMAELIDLLQSLDRTADRGPDLVRALALAAAAEYTPVRYDVSGDELPSAFI